MVPYTFNNVTHPSYHGSICVRRSNVVVLVAVNGGYNSCSGQWRDWFKGTLCKNFRSIYRISKQNFFRLALQYLGELAPASWQCRSAEGRNQKQLTNEPYEIVLMTVNICNNILFLIFVKILNVHMMSCTHVAFLKTCIKMYFPVFQNNSVHTMLKPARGSCKKKTQTNRSPIRNLKTEAGPYIT